MEFHDYYALLKKNLAVLVTTTLLFGVVAAIFTIKQKTTYQTSMTIDISRHQNQKQSDVNYFQYDNYYTSQVASALADNATSWLSSPSIVSSIFTKAGYEAPEGSLKDMAKIFTAKKKVASSSAIDLSYVSDDKQKSETLIKQAGETVSDRVSNYNKTDTSGKFETYLSDPIIVETPKSVTLNTIIAALIGLFLALSFAVVKESLKK